MFFGKHMKLEHSWFPQTERYYSSWRTKKQKQNKTKHWKCYSKHTWTVRYDSTYDSFLGCVVLCCLVFNDIIWCENELFLVYLVFFRYSNNIFMDFSYLHIKCQQRKTIHNSWCNKSTVTFLRGGNGMTSWWHDEHQILS